MRATIGGRIWPIRVSLLIVVVSILVGCLPEGGPDPTALPSPPALKPTPTLGESATQAVLSSTPTLGEVGSQSTGEASPTTESVTPAPSAGGPWLLFSNQEGIWIINPDGSGLRQVDDQGGLGIHELRDGLSLSGKHLALISAEQTYHRLTLRVVSLPDGKRQATIPLTTDETEPAADAVQGDPKLEAVRPIVDVPSLAWSPDGSRLAFVGVFDGPSSDLYVYEAHDGHIVRLTDGPTQAIHPRWSPDGEEIVHVAVSGMGTGAGFDVRGVWSAAADGSGARLLYEPNSGDEIPIGWLDETRFVIYSWRVRCGQEQLRSVDLLTLEQQVLWPGAFSNVALDPETGTLLLAVDQWVARCETDGQGGVFVMQPGSSSAWRVVEDDVHRLSWSPEAGLFLGVTEHGVIAVSRGGDFIDLAMPAGASGLPVIAPGTRALAWTGSGLWLGALNSSLEQPPRRLFSEAVGQAIWGPQGQRLLFFSSGALYMADSPDFEPQPVAEGVSAGALLWVQP